MKPFLLIALSFIFISCERIVSVDAEIVVTASVDKLINADADKQGRLCATIVFNPVKDGKVLNEKRTSRPCATVEVIDGKINDKIQLQVKGYFDEINLITAENIIYLGSPFTSSDSDEHKVSNQYIGKVNSFVVQNKSHADVNFSLSYKRSDIKMVVNQESFANTVWDCLALNNNKNEQLCITNQVPKDIAEGCASKYEEVEAYCLINLIPAKVARACNQIGSYLDTISCMEKYIVYKNN